MKGEKAFRRPISTGTITEGRITQLIKLWGKIVSTTRRLNLRFNRL